MQKHAVLPALRLIVLVLLAVLIGIPGDFAAAHAQTAAAAFGNHSESLSSLMFGLFIGVMLTAAFYLFFIWIVMRDRGQVFLLLLLLCLAANIASTNDLLMDQLSLYSPMMRSLLQNYSMILSYIFSIFFTYYFLEIDVNGPDFKIPLFSLAAVLFAVLVYSIFDRQLVHLALPILGILTITLILAAGIVCLRYGVTGSFTHIIAFLFFLGGSLARPLYDLGLLPDSRSSDNLAHVSFSMAAIMFAVVIASQFAARQEEKEKALALSNERFTLATRGANEGLFDWNLQTGEVFFSEQFKKILGTRMDNTPESLKIWLRMILPADRRVARDALRRFRRNRSANTINVEYRIPGADHQRRWLHSKAVAVRDIGGRIVRLVGSISDITQRKQSDVALRASEARFRSITEAHPVPILIVGLQGGTVLYASPAAEQILSTTQNLLLHEPFERFLADQKSWTEIAHAMNHGHEVNLKEVTLTRGNGTTLPTALSARRINYQNENAMAIGLYDLSERKLAEAQIARQHEALQQSEKMAALGGLLAGVAHELNNPLSVVLGQATLLMEGTQEQRITTRAEKIFKAADRCSRIVKSFLALARRKEPERKPVELNTLVQAALELLGFQIRTENIEIALALQPGLPEINGDPDQLTQVITNLVLNAAQAMQGWTGKRRLTISSWPEDNGRIFFSVADSGPGVPAEIRSRIFEPFFTTKGSKGGTGVGLSLCLNIVESHGGRMTLEETPGGGATFVVELPMAQEAGQSGQKATPDNVQLPPNLHILLVDDEVEIAQTLADLMQPDGHNIDVAANGALALDRLRKKSYDVVISDLRMPVLDGPGLYEALGREMPAYHAKIIFVTGDTLSAHVQAFLNEHPVRVIEKPYRLEDVRRTIAALLKENASGSSMGAAESASSPPLPPAPQR